MIKRFGQLTIVLALASLCVDSRSVYAAKGTKPDQPKIVVISTKKISSKMVALKFTVELPTNTGTGSITSTVISGGGKSCIIKKSSRICTIKRSLEGKAVSYYATTKNSCCVSNRSVKVRVPSTPGTWILTGYTSAGFPKNGATNEVFPGVAYNTSYTRVLSTQPTKWTKFQAVRRTNVGSASLRSRKLVSITSGDIQFMTNDVVGLAILETRGSGSGLVAVTSTGTTYEALISGTAIISNFYSTANDKYYVLFQTPVALVNGGPACLLAEVNALTGTPTCVDNSLSSINWSLGAQSGNGNSPIQLDQYGNIFYSGTTSGGNRVLRKYSNASTADLINDNIYVTDFVILGDSTAIVAGTTTSTSSQWVRKISPSGSLSTLAAGAQTYFLRKFVDGNVYMGLWGGSYYGVKRLNVSTGTLDQNYWIASSLAGSGATKEFDVEPFCTAVRNNGLCGYSGAMVSNVFNIGTTNTFAISGNRGATGTLLMQYFPTLGKTNTTITALTGGLSVGSKVVLTGLSPTGSNSMSVYDTSTKQETYVVDSSNETEIYNMTYVPSTNKVMYNGLRFSDNRYVVGEVSMP